MDDLEKDTALVKALSAYTKLAPSRMAIEIGAAFTTLTRPAKGKATTRLGRGTIEKLRARWPDFPGWADFGSDVREPNAIPVRLEGASMERLRQDLPVYGSALGAVRRIEGEAIEQTNLNRAEVVQYIQRPAMLNGRASAYALYVQGSSMAPRFEDGELVIVDPKDRLRIGDDVVVYLRPDNPEDDNGEAARASLIKRLKRRTATYIELEQFQPASIFQIAMEEVVDVHRVIPWSELIA